MMSEVNPDESMPLVLAVTGATGAYAARLLAEKCPWPLTLVASDWGKKVYERECGAFDELVARSCKVYDDTDLAAPIASGSVPTVGMLILPCTTNTLSKVAGGAADTLITRAAHCHLKERRKLVLCVRESPWSTIDLSNAHRVSTAGGIIMPVSPPYYMVADEEPGTVTVAAMLDVFVDRVLAVLGHPAPANWETNT